MTETKPTIIDHHTKYIELHGYDETVEMTRSEHSLLHIRLRREGKCAVSPDELRKISNAAHRRGSKYKAQQKTYSKVYYEGHKDELNARKKAYRDEHKDEIEAYYEAHKDEINARKRAYREAHQDEILMKEKACREAHRDDAKAYNEAKISYYEVCWELYGDEMLADIAKHEDEANERLYAANKQSKYTAVIIRETGDV